MPLEPALNASVRYLDSKTAGKVAFYAAEAASDQPPLLLLHSVNAAASAYEVKPLFDHFRNRRPTYALDLPGYGLSDRSSRRYSPQLFAATIQELLREIGGAPADVVALSLASEFAARAAYETPALFQTLTVVSPTGLGREIRVPGDGLYRFLTLPLWSQALFAALSSKASIRLFLGRNFVGDLPEPFVDYAYAASHQPGARNAPLYFLSGQLFSPRIRPEVYEKLAVPALILYDRDPNVSFEKLPQLLETNSNWRAERITPSFGLPHWELLPETVAALDAFWAANR